MMKTRKWSIQEQAVFLKRTGELLARGYPIAEAIESLSYQLHPRRKAELTECLASLKRGLVFHDVLVNLGFQEELVGYVYFAEQHGSFAAALQEGSSLALKKAKSRHKLFKLLQYPLLLILITGFLFIFVDRILLPKFTVLFQSMNLKPNIFSKVITAFSTGFPTFLGIFFAFLIAAALYYRYVFRKIPILQQKTRLVKIPVLGHALKLLYTHYFSTQLSFLLSGGISFSEALILFERNVRQPFYSQLAKAIKMRLVTGEKLESIFNSFSFFEKEFPMIVKHGQENGKLEQELFMYSQHCLAVLEELVEKNLRMLQPVLYVSIGFLIVSMYLAILLPMFHLMDSI